MVSPSPSMKDLRTLEQPLVLPFDGCLLGKVDISCIRLLVLTTALAKVINTLSFHQAPLNVKNLAGDPDILELGVRQHAEFAAPSVVRRRATEPRCWAQDQFGDLTSAGLMGTPRIAVSNDSKRKCAIFYLPAGRIASRGLPRLTALRLSRLCVQKPLCALARAFSNRNAASTE